MKEGFGFQEGLFWATTNKRDYNKDSWGYEIGDDGYGPGRSDDAAPALRAAS